MTIIFYDEPFWLRLISALIRMATNYRWELYTTEIKLNNENE